MCGIVGLLNINNDIDTYKFDIPNATTLLDHRGPDDYGHFLDSQIYLAQRRLSIIDLKTGHQPIFNEDKTKCIVYNGEIYNFKEIRGDLEKKGHKFATNSDTEVIIHSYEEWGQACLEKFRGMFAFAVWDTVRKNLFIARDRLGIKPLFYALYDDTFYFASEMKAILQYAHFPREMDFDALASYFTLGYIPAPLTIYKHIRKLLPGYMLNVQNGQMKINQYWDIHFIPDRNHSSQYFIDNFMGLLEEAVKLRMISDVPIGSFLSGGIDSGIVVALMSKLTAEPTNSFCMGFGGNIGGYFDERKYAHLIASIYGTRHHEEVVSPNLQLDIVENIVNSFDEPFADPTTIPSYFLCQITSQRAKVALSGLGGDEVFGGYERYLGYKVSNIYERLPYTIREKVIKKIVERIPERKDGHYTVNHLKRFVRSASQPLDKRYFGFLSGLGRYDNLFLEPDNYRDNFKYCEDLIINYFINAEATEPLDRVFYCDIKTYLPEDILACTDRISMRHSLEVRVPFLDHKFMEFCATIPNEMKIKGFNKKYILKKAVEGLLPKEVITHRKQGFVGPMTRWLQYDLKSYVIESLSDSNLDKHGLFNKKTIKNILDDHFEHNEINDKLIWSLVIFQTWHNLFMD